jgi:hypothetical protein
MRAGLGGLLLALRGGSGVMQIGGQLADSLGAHGGAPGAMAPAGLGNGAMDECMNALGVRVRTASPDAGHEQAPRVFQPGQTGRRRIRDPHRPLGRRRRKPVLAPVGQRLTQNGHNLACGNRPVATGVIRTMNGLTATSPSAPVAGHTGGARMPAVVVTLGTGFPHPSGDHRGTARQDRHQPRHGIAHGSEPGPEPGSEPGSEPGARRLVRVLSRGEPTGRARAPHWG